ncbi:MAG TPA: GWxTD domain-containing protein [Thermoanaerobaculia bacterium]|nr:GWxTD domain-containing protein [Thermoanaerobaculia bacterium]
MATERVAALLALALAAGGCRPSASAAAETAHAWASGPARWLLLADDQHGLQQVQTNTDFATFLARFWSCRDADPKDDDNPFARLFAERVIAADRLYEETGVRGSLTPRGHALVLLGPPRFLRYSQRRSPTLEGATGAGARPTNLLRVEIWGYLPADLPPALATLLGADPRSEQELALTFLVSGRHTRLLEGESLLELAARAASRCGADQP